MGTEAKSLERALADFPEPKLTMFLVKKKSQVLNGWQDRAKAEVKHRNLQKTRTKSVLAVESIAAAQKLAFHLQGDAELSTKAAFQQRLALRRHPAVLSLLDAWWDIAVQTARQRAGTREHGKPTQPRSNSVAGALESTLDVSDGVSQQPILDRRDSLGKEDYIACYRLLYLELLGASEYDEADCDAEAMEEWCKDSLDGKTMERAQFLDAIFECCDLYTSTLDPTDYSSFLASTLEQVSGPDGTFLTLAALHEKKERRAPRDGQRLASEATASSSSRHADDSMTTAAAATQNGDANGEDGLEGGAAGVAGGAGDDKRRLRDKSRRHKKSRGGIARLGKSRRHVTDAVDMQHSEGLPALPQAQAQIAKAAAAAKMIKHARSEGHLRPAHSSSSSAVDDPQRDSCTCADGPEGPRASRMMAGAGHSTRWRPTGMGEAWSFAAPSDFGEVEISRHQSSVGLAFGSSTSRFACSEPAPDYLPPWEEVLKLPGCQLYGAAHAASPQRKLAPLDCYEAHTSGSAVRASHRQQTAAEATDIEARSSNSSLSTRTSVPGRTRLRRAAHAPELLHAWQFDPKFEDEPSAGIPRASPAPRTITSSVSLSELSPVASHGARRWSAAQGVHLADAGSPQSQSSPTRSSVRFSIPSSILVPVPPPHPTVMPPIYVDPRLKELEKHSEAQPVAIIESAASTAAPCMINLLTGLRYAHARKMSPPSHVANYCR